MVIDEHLIVAAVGAIFGGLATLIPTLLVALSKFRSAENKMRIQLENMRVENEKKLMEAKAEFKKETDGSDNLTKLINGMLGQISGMSEVTSKLSEVSGALNANTTATNKFVETVETKFNRLDDNVDDFGARLIRATNTMEEAKGAIQQAGANVLASSKEIQKNSETLANSILEQLAALKQTAEATQKTADETLQIVTDIDERVRKLEEKPEPVPPPPIPAVVNTINIPSEAQLAPIEEKPNDRPTSS